MLDLDHDAVCLHVRLLGFEAVVGEVDEILEATHREEALLFALVFGDADDGGFSAIDEYGLAEGRLLTEEVIFRDGADEADVALFVLSVQDSPFGELDGVHVEPVGGSGDQDGAGGLFAVPDSAANEGPGGGGDHAFYGGQPFRILLLEEAAASKIGVEGAVLDSSRDDHEDVHAEVFDLTTDIAFYAGGDGDEEDDGARSDRDSEGTEERSLPPLPKTAKGGGEIDGKGKHRTHASTR